MIGFKVNVKFLANELVARNERSAKIARLALSSQIKKDSEHYIPARDWHLRNRGRYTETSVSWHTPYARRLYYNPQYNFSKDKNPNASGLWFEKAKEKHLEEWLQIPKRTYWEAWGKGGRT